MQTRVAEPTGNLEQAATEAVHRVSDAASDFYFRAIEYTRAHPRNATLIALGVGVTLGCLLSRGRSSGGLLSSLALAVGGAAVDAFREEVE
jgi:ElaB/YqjD/DUF883 family membrane-anchored ribosome-binding protein